jgi:hypothetical protein
MNFVDHEAMFYIRSSGVAIFCSRGFGCGKSFPWILGPFRRDMKVFLEDRKS